MISALAICLHFLFLPQLTELASLLMRFLFVSLANIFHQVESFWGFSCHFQVALFLSDSLYLTLMGLKICRPNCFCDSLAKSSHFERMALKVLFFTFQATLIQFYPWEECSSRFYFFWQESKLLHRRFHHLQAIRCV